MKSGGIWILLLAVACLISPGLYAGGARPASGSDWQQGYTLVIASTEDPQSLNKARDEIVAAGGRIAVMFPPHVMMGWIPEARWGRLQGKAGIELITQSPVDAAALPYKDAQTIAGVNAYNYIVTGLSLLEEEYGQQHKGLPFIDDAHPHPVLEQAAGPNGKVPAGNSDSMTGTVVVCLFFIESNGTIDPNTYTWSSTDQSDTINRATAGLSWWSSQAPLYGQSVSYAVYWYAHDSPVSSTGYEPVLHSSLDEGLWIDQIMHNAGYTSGTYFQEVTDFNTWLKGWAGTTWAYSVFIGYNPPPAPSTFTNGRFAYAYMGGPFSQMLFNTDGWGPSNFGLGLTHETGHIFWACDEYYQEGYGGCQSCDICSALRPSVLNGNCEYCNPDAVSCMMRENSHSLCSYTPPQIGWIGCSYPDASLSNGVPLSDYMYCTASQSGWKYYSFTVAAGSANLVVDLYSQTEDADLYVRYGAKPSLSAYDCRPFIGGTSSEQCTFAAPSSGQWWVGINNWVTTNINYNVQAAWSNPCLFCDDFEDGVLDPDWTYIKPAWSETGGDLVGTPARKAVAVAKPTFAGCRDCSVEAEMRTAGGSGNKLWLLGWYVNKNNTMELLLKEENNKIVLKQRIGGRIVKKQAAAVTISPNTVYNIKMTFTGSYFDVLVNAVQVMTFWPAGAVPTGTVGFQVKNTVGRFGLINVQ